MTTTAVSDYSSDSVRYYRHYFQDRDAEAPITDTEDDPEKDSNKKKSGERLPRIVLRNKLGKELDTFTTLQEAIYRAKRNVRDSMQATQPEEWRLPNAPLPSRPDFSRAVPSITELRRRRKAKQQKTAKSTPSLPYDVDVDDVGFVAESLQHLPKVPSLSFLRQDLLAEPKRYFPFVQSMLLFKKFLSETDKRDHVYNFPGFCTGCQRMGLCYGCERSLEPHYHMDQPVKTGGGFTFYKRDRPEHELKHRHPSNWRYTFPELAKRAGHFEAWKDKEGLSGDQEMNYDEVRKNVLVPHLETEDNKATKLTGDQGAEGETTLADRQYKDNMSEEDEGILVDKITPEEEELLGMKPSESTSQSTKRSKPSSPSTKRSKLSSRSTKISGLDGDDEMYSAGTGSEVRGDTAHTGSKGKRVYIVEGLKHLDGKSSGTGDGTYTDQSTDYDDDDERGEGSQLRKSRRKIRTRRTRDGTQSDEDDDDRSHDRSHSQSKSPFSRSSSEKRRLYKAPAPFKIKKKSRKIVASVSPFSSNRKYNLPKGDGFKVKKSGKSPTQIKEFKQHEGDWKAPKQFEVKKSDKKSTDFWSPPPQKEKPKPVKIKRESPKKVQHPPSPDSGLESEKMTEEDDQGSQKEEQPRLYVTSENENVDSNSSFVTSEPGKLDQRNTFDNFEVMSSRSEFSHAESKFDHRLTLTLEQNDLEKPKPESSQGEELTFMSKGMREKIIKEYDLETSDHQNFKNDAPNVEKICDLTESSDKNIKKEMMADGDLTDTFRSSDRARVEGLLSCEMSQSEEVKYKESVTKQEEIFLNDKECKIQNKVKHSPGSKTNICKTLVRDGLNTSHDKLKEISRNRTNASSRSKVKKGSRVEGHKGSRKLKKKKYSVNDKQSDEEHYNEIDFDKLPSIKETLEKILPKKIVIDLNLDVFERESQVSDKSTRTEDRVLGQDKNNQALNSRMDTEGDIEHAMNLKRPQSVSFNFKELSQIALQQAPSQSETPELLELIKINKIKTRIPKKQIIYPAVLPPFTARFKPKKTKSSNPRRVGQGRQSSISSKNEGILNSHESQTTIQSDSLGLESNSDIMVGDMASSRHSDAQSEKDSSELISDKAKNNEQMPPVEGKNEPQERNNVGPVTNLNLNSNKRESVQEYVYGNKTTDVPEPPPPPPVTMETDQQRETTPAAQTKPSSPVEPPQNIISTPAKTPAPVIEKIKKEKPKKTKKEKVKDEPKPPPTPPPPVVERSMSPDTPLPQLPSDADTEVAMATPTPEPTKEVPELPSFDIPALPEIKDEKKTKVDDRRTQLIQSVPKMKEVKEALPKKKFMPKVTKKSMPKRRRSSAKAPVTPEELKQMTDPLDFLAKYCIINKDRLPYYDRIYHNIVSNQTPKYERIHDTHASISGSASFPVLADHEMNMLHDMTVINRAQEPARIGLSVPEQYLEKICYTLDFLEQKQNKMSLDLHNLETEKIKKLAEKAKELNPHIIRPDFQVKPSKKASKKKKKKKGKGKEEKADSDEEVPPEKLTAADITDRIIVDRIDDKTLNSLCKQPDIHQLDLEMDRIAQKVSDIDERIEHLENEKNLLGIYCMEYFFRDQGRNKKPTEFRRQQSSLYNKLHPDPDIEMNMEELEGALQVINHSLLTEKEFEYLYNVLNLPGRLKINFQLFAVIAALSEKVTQLDPVIRKLLNKVDYGALNVKMDRSRELFELLDDGTITPSGNAPADSLAVELRAGGLSVEHTNYVLSKFNRNGNGFIDFLDFVTYVPLFVEIHEKIVKDPFNVQLFV